MSAIDRLYQTVGRYFGLLPERVDYNSRPAAEPHFYPGIDVRGFTLDEHATGELALSLLDDDVRGFLLVQVREPENGGLGADVYVHANVPKSAWQAAMSALSCFALEVEHQR